jgi:hypothetical protein
MYIGGSTGNREICTNWIPIRIKTPPPEEGEQPCCDEDRIPYPLVCFDDIFTIPSCS